MAHSLISIPRPPLIVLYQFSDMKTKIALLLLLCISSFAAFCQQQWKPASSEVSFKIKNAGATVTGHFQGLKTTLVFSKTKLETSSLEGSIDVATIKTGIHERDKHLKRKKYFDADNYKTIEIASVELYNKGTQYAGKFNVTIKGTTKQMEIPFDFIERGNEATFKSSFILNRRDYDVGGKNMIMSDQLIVSIDIKAIK